ncbi:flagellar assembly protein FliH [Actinomycetes bacterium NPDC127524]
MILLSRIIKSYHAAAEKAGNKTIKIREFSSFSHAEEDMDDPLDAAHAHTHAAEKARHEAEEILNGARSRANELIQEAQAQKEFWEQTEKQQYIQQAFDQGYQEGLESGRQRGYGEMSQSIEFAKTVVEASKKDYQQHIESSEKIILELGISVAEKIIGKAMETDSEYFFSAVKKAIKNAREYRDIQLHVHPAHYEFILSRKEELLSIFPKETDFYVYPDHDLNEGSCIIESQNGRIDASIDTQLEVIKQKLADMLEGE